MRKSLFYYLVALLCPFCARAKPASARQLNIGDTLGALVINNVLHHSNNAINLANYKGKPLLLEFFASWCGGCVAGLPKLDSLRSKFAGQLEVVLVSRQKKAVLQAFAAKYPRLKNFTLVAEDTLLNGLFFNRLLPHVVWIDADGKVTAITSGEEVTEANVSKLVAGKPMQRPEKKDLREYIGNQPLFDTDDGHKDELRLRSTIATYIKGAGSMSGLQKKSFTQRYYHINMPALQLYRMAAGFDANRLEVEVSNPQKYIKPTGIGSSWDEANAICYEMIAPANESQAQLNQWMWQDLDRYLGLRCRYEKRSKLCWVIYTSNKHDANASSRATKMQALKAESDSGQWLQQISVNELLQILNGHPDSPIITDSSGYKGRLNLLLPKMPTNVAAIQQALAPYGLLLEERQAEVDMFIMGNGGAKLED